jgi:tRNA 5-methylaminomethyl-2-thiouridine biosynthesis bifunctional protein
MLNPDMKYIQPAVVTEKNSQPFAVQYDDVYFNDLNGMAETQYVFIEGNQLIPRWQERSNEQNFCVAETGFGSGLNFLATCLAWQQCLVRPQHLHFISTELYPMSHQDLSKAHQLFPEIKPFSDQLLQQYGSFRNGIHRFRLSHQITLTLLLGDATEELQQLQAQVDAWYLDGFAPSRNPDMWSESLFKAMAKLSHPMTTLATYSAASLVRKGLTDVGFNITKRTGFGPKRDMLIGKFTPQGKSHLPNQLYHPWPKAQFTQQKVTIIGAGIAGLSLARSFKLAGFETTIIEQNQNPMMAASGNKCGMVMPVITAQSSPEALFYLRAFEHALLQYDATFYQAVGITEYLRNQTDQVRAIAISKLGLPHELINYNDETINYPSSGFVVTKKLSKQWQQYVDNWVVAEVNNIDYMDGWQLFDSTNQLIHECEVLIIAAGMSSQKLIKQQQLSLTAKLGQTAELRTETPVKIKEIQLNQGYIIPTSKTAKSFVLGATFDHLPQNQWYSSIEQNDPSYQSHHPRNLQHWSSFDFFADLQQAQILSTHTAIRATTPDHLPICGPVIDQKQFESDYQDLHHGRHWQSYPPAKAIKNLYVLSGLGSRGFTSAPLLADCLMAMITGQPLPLEADLCKIIHPNRFNYRRSKKPPTIKK